MHKAFVNLVFGIVKERADEARKMGEGVENVNEDGGWTVDSAERVKAEG